MSKRFTGGSFSPQSGGQTRYQNRTKYSNQSTGCYDSNPRYKNQQQQGQSVSSLQLNQSPNKRVRNGNKNGHTSTPVTIHRAKSQENDMQKTTDCATVPACEEYHQQQTQLYEAEMCDAHVVASVPNSPPQATMDETNSTSSSYGCMGLPFDTTQPLSVQCSAVEQQQQQPPSSEAIMIQQQQQQIYATRSFSEYDTASCMATASSPYMPIAMSPAQHHHHHPHTAAFYASPQHANMHLPPPLPDYPTFAAGFYSPIYQASLQQQFQAPPPFQMYDAAGSASPQAVFMSPQASSSNTQGNSNMFQTQTTPQQQPIYLTTPPPSSSLAVAAASGASSSHECLAQQSQPSQPQQDVNYASANNTQQQQSYVVYHSPAQQGTTALLSPPLSTHHHPHAYTMMYSPHLHHLASGSPPTPNSSMIQLVPSAASPNSQPHQQQHMSHHQTTPTSTRYYNRSGRFGGQRRFYDNNNQQQAQAQQPSQEEVAMQIQQQMQLQMQQQSFYSIPFNGDMSHCQSSCLDPSIYQGAGAAPIMDPSMMVNGELLVQPQVQPAPILSTDPSMMFMDPYAMAAAAAASNTQMADQDAAALTAAQTAEEEATVEEANEPPLACYVCRGKRMCFCYFLKVRYYKFPSFLDLVDYQYKKWRTNTSKASRLQS